MLVAVNYHYIRHSFNSPFPSIFGITPENFEKQLLKLGEIGSFVSQADIEAEIKGLRKLPEKSFVITFDDGLKEQFELALPILEKLEIPAIFFPNTKPLVEKSVSSVHKIHLIRSELSPKDFLSILDKSLEGFTKAELKQIDRKASLHYKYDDSETAFLKYLLNFVLDLGQKEVLVNNVFEQLYPGLEASLSEHLYMDESEIKALGAKGMIGSHGHDHLPIGLLSLEEMDEQIDRSSEILTRVTGVKPISFSFPYGSSEACGEIALNKLRNAGYLFSFSMNRGGNKEIKAPYLFSRFDNNDMPLGKANAFNDNDVFKITL